MKQEEKFVRGLGLFDSTMIVAGAMIGSGIFIVSAEISRQVGSPGSLLVVWLITGLLTLIGAVSYGELAAMMPKAGGQYVYLREAFSPMWGFLYGWTLFLVIQTGTIAAVAVGFARYMGVLWPSISESNYIISPIHLSSGYAISLSTTQLIGILMIALLTWLNTRGLRAGKLVQNIFTVTKTGALVALIALGIGWGIKSGVLGGLKAFEFSDYAGQVGANFANFWTVRETLQDVGSGLTAATAFGLLIAICVAQTNSLFSADAWNNITFTAGARAYYAMAQDGLFFRPAGELNRRAVPAWGLAIQGLWAVVLVMPRTIRPDGSYGNLYSNLLDYVISAALIFYILTVAGIYALRRKQPDAERPYKAFGYPVLPALYIIGAAVILVVLFSYKTATTWPGLLIVLSGAPVYLFWRAQARKPAIVAQD
jgi:amino acid transporter